MVVGTMPFMLIVFSARLVIIMFSTRRVIIVFSVRYVILMVGVRSVIIMFSMRHMIIMFGVRFVILKASVFLCCTSTWFQITDPAADAILFKCQCVVLLHTHVLLQEDRFDLIIWFQSGCSNSSFRQR
jgi:hypothetical protein